MHLTIITGPMYAGKTTELLRLYRRYRKADKNVLIVKSSIDLRYDETQVTTHDNNKSETCIIVKNLTELPIMSLNNEVYNSNNKLKIHVIAIDEGHFFDNQLNFFIRTFENTDIIVLISGLVQQANRNKFFKGMLELYADADNIIKLNAVCCKCKNDNAIYSHRTGLNDNGEEICVDNGEGMYISLCRNCKINI